MTLDLAGLAVHELAPLLESRAASPVEVTKAVLDNIARQNEVFNAYIDVYAESALDQAHVAEQEMAGGLYRGPLHGVPVGVKDNIYCAGKATTMGSEIHRNFVAPHDATVVDRLTAAGAVLTGKLNMHEYALGVTTDNPHFGTCRNPRNVEMCPGGSSGGSGAAVAANLATAALGTDTSGSIRIPSAWCGVVGLKPTYGRLSRFGVFPEAWTLDHVGPMTRSVKDAAIMLDCLSGHDPRDQGSLRRPATRTVEHLRRDCRGTVVGVVEDFFFADVDDGVARCARDGIEAMRSLGADIRPIDIEGLREAEWALTIIDISETSAVHHANLRARPDDFGDDVRLLLQLGEMPTAVDYLQAQQVRRHLKVQMEKAFTLVDVIVGPTLPIRTPRVGELTAQSNGVDVDVLANAMRLVGPASLLGLPALSMPCGLVDGLPVGMQVIGPAANEQIVLDVGHAVECESSTHGPHHYLPR